MFAKQTNPLSFLAPFVMASLFVSVNQANPFNHLILVIMAFLLVSMNQPHLFNLFVQRFIAPSTFLSPKPIHCFIVADQLLLKPIFSTFRTAMATPLFHLVLL